MTKPAKSNGFAFKVIEDDAAINAAIKSIATRGAKLGNDMHIAACSVLNKLINSGDVPLAERRLNELFKAMPKASRVNALKQWFELYGPISFAKGKAVYAKRENVADLFTEACKTPFWTLKGNEGVAYQPLDIVASINALIAKLGKDESETKRDHSKVKKALEALLPAKPKEAGKPAKATKPVKAEDLVA